jgi:hypothetical protein
MAGMRGPGRRQKRRSRAVPAAALSAAALVVVLAAAGIGAYMHAGRSVATKPHRPGLPTRVTGEESVGLANLGPPAAPGSASSSASLVVPAQSGLAFTEISGRNVEPSEQWQADQMGGGAYILVFTPDRLCLTAFGAGDGATVGLNRCRSTLSQRWHHPYLGTDSAGRGYWQLRSASDRRCLAVGGIQSDGAAGVALRPCSAGKPWQQLIVFLTAF